MMLACMDFTAFATCFKVKHIKILKDHKFMFLGTGSSQCSSEMTFSLYFIYSIHDHSIKWDHLS